MAWSEAARQAAAEMRRRKAAGQAWRLRPKGALLDRPALYRSIAGRRLSAGDQKTVMARVLKADQEARKAGRIQGGFGIERSQVALHVQALRSAKLSKVSAASALRAAPQSDLTHALSIEKSQLASIQAERGRYGVQWAERNVRARATTQKMKIRSLKARIIRGIK